MGLLLPESHANSLLKVRWLGHASFLVTSQDGTRWLSDPYEESIGLLMPPVEPDFVTISHHHFDHSSLQALTGTPPVFDQRTEYRNHRYRVRAVSTFHDSAGGERWGENLVFVVELGGVRLAHLGDLGHVLTQYQRAELGPVDVIMIPVGGVYTLDGAKATEVVKQVEPHIVIPMHYRMPQLVFPLDEVRMFTSRWPEAVFHTGGTMEISQAMLTQKNQVHVLACF